MDWDNIIGWLGIISGLGGLVASMVLHQMVIKYTQKNLKSLCYYLYEEEHYHEGKLNMYDLCRQIRTIKLGRF